MPNRALSLILVLAVAGCPARSGPTDTTVARPMPPSEPSEPPAPPAPSEPPPPPVVDARAPVPLAVVADAVAKLTAKHGASQAVMLPGTSWHAVCLVDGLEPPEG